ncbi:MAG: bifunctional nuclease family protein [Myxococcota bacterium]
MLIEMSVARLAVDPFTNTPIVVLKDEAGKNAVPIWIGLLEASAIAMELEKVEMARPMTHDLMKTMLAKTGVEVARVEVSGLRDNTYYATICLRHGGREIAIDARPSDALALALRTGARICVDESIVEKARHLDLRGRTEVCDPELDEDAYRDFLASLADEPTAKWKM